MRAPTIVAALLLACPVAADQQAAPAGRPSKTSEPRLRYGNRPDALFPYGTMTVYKDVFADPLVFRGAGRELPEPAVEKVRIGFIGPLTNVDQPLLAPGQRPLSSGAAGTLFGRHLLQGALLALDEANREGGYKGKPFELVRRTDLVQWGQTSDELVKFTYDDGVWAVLSSVDSNHNHVLSRVSLKTEVAVVNAGSTDPTLTEHAMPWLARCMSDDRQHAFELLNYLFRVKEYKRVAVLRVNNRDGRVGIMEFNKGAKRLGHPVLLELRFRPGHTDFRALLRELNTVPAQAIVLWANPAEGAAIVRQVRELGMKQEIVGFDRLAHPLFLEAAGEAADRIVLTSSYNPAAADARGLEFQKRYTAQFGEAPDTWAAHGYDGMRYIVEGIRKGGLNRARVRDALFAVERFQGVSGEVVFDTTQNRVTRPWLARVENGRLVHFRIPDWPRTASLGVVHAPQPARW